MNTKRLGSNGPVTSTLGLGCMGMSDFYGTRQTRDDAESIETIKAALDAGINFLNTADYYGSGHNELLIREALKTRDNKPLLSVKFGGLRTPAGGFSGFDLRPEAIKNFLTYSLVRLNVETIDIYEPGRVLPSTAIEEVAGTIGDLINEGKVKYLGLSEVNADQLRRAHKVHPVTVVEVEYSLATRVIEKELLHTCRELGVGVVAYGVLSRGLLTGSLAGQFDTNDFRSSAPRFIGQNLETNKRRIHVLQTLASEKGCTPAQLAIAWVLHQGDDILPLIGTTKRNRLYENLAAIDIKLAKPELEQLNQNFAEGAFAGDRYTEQQMGIVVT